MISVTIDWGMGYSDEFESLSSALSYAVDEVAKHLQREINEIGEWEMKGISAEDDAGNVYQLTECPVNGFKWELDNSNVGEPAIAFNQDSGRFTVLIDMERSPA